MNDTLLTHRRGDLKGPIDPAELPADFIFYRPPLRHQLYDFLEYRDRPYFALFHEQRVRKTKIVNDIFRYRYEKGEVDALVVIAYPNGVHRGWIDEGQADFPPALWAKTIALAWSNGCLKRTATRPTWIASRAHDGPVVVTFNCESIIGNSPMMKFFEWFILKRKVMLVLDESAWASNWSKRTQRVMAFSRRRNVIVKAILDGTPVEEGPGEIYHPTQFLYPSLMGYETKGAFQARYFEYEEEDIDEEVPDLDPVTRQPKFDPATGAPIMLKTGRMIRQRARKKRWDTGAEYEVFKGYRNLEELFSRMFLQPGPHGYVWASRVRRSDVSDAPPKTYQSRYFELTPAQRKVYDDLRDRYVAELVEGGTIRAANVLLRMTRLQMVARNYYPPERTGVPCATCAGEGLTAEDEICGACEGVGIVIRLTDLKRIDPKNNPAIEALSNELTASNTPTLIWCRFRQDVTDVLAETARLGLNFFRYDGSMKEIEREDGYRRFRAGEGDGIAATIGSGLQRGHDCRRARLMIYYSNDFGLRSRRQSEDRAESLEKTESTGIVDLVAVDTRDIVAIKALREKKSIAAALMGDPIERWI